ncbi:hypothetical protein BKA69DRAFT_112298 [Paraphysoderma sedebokerense]|nr:hypothetical protein BKA69DRAFT_112298 [Paraphysoderma sedebokerense]
MTLNAVSFVMFNPELSSPECFIPTEDNPFGLKLRIILAIPLVLMAFLLLFAIFNARIFRIPIYRAIEVCSKCFRRGYQRPDDDTLLRRQKEAYFGIARGFNTILSLVYITIAAKSLSFFDCTKESDGYYYLDAEPSMRCYEESWWHENVLFAWLGFCLYVLGIPIYFFVVFYFVYQEKQKHAFFIRMRTLCREVISQNTYVKPQYQYLIFVQILLKLLVITIQRFFTKYGGLQILLLILICVISFIFYHSHQPYTYRSLNHLETLSSVLSAFILAIGMLLYIDQFPAENERFLLTVVLLSLIALFLIATVVAALYEFTSVLTNARCCHKKRATNKDKNGPSSVAASKIELLKA